MKKILTFGSFDGIHEGHRHFLSHAKTLGSYLIVALAPDSVIQAIKGRAPKETASQRITQIKKSHLVDEVILADKQNHSWDILKKVKPNIIAIGFDQNELHSSLGEYLNQKYPDIENSEGDWKTNPKKPKIVVLEHYSKNND